MVSVDQALDLILARVNPTPVEIVALRLAAGRALASDAAAPHDSPPFDTSAMDGFAVRAADLAKSESGAAPDPTQGFRILRIQSEASAGDADRATLGPGRAVRINTGAPLPHGADAVVRIEDARIEGDLARLPAGIAVGLAVRRAGEDYRNGQTLLRAGRRLDSRAIGLLASLGMAAVPVHRRPRVGVMSSGDEIVEPGEPLRFGQIHDSNRHALMTLLEGFGAEVHDLGRVPDDRAEVRRALERGFEFDFLVTAGGVSMGTKDFIRPTALELGVEEIVYQVRQRPGKPLFVARGADSGALMFGLPGNPVSVMVTALIYARAAILTAQGRADAAPPWTRAILTEPISKPEGWTVFARADFAPDEAAESAAGAAPSEIEGHGARPRVKPSPGQGSHQFSALAAADGLLRLGETATNPRPGDEVDFLNLSLVC